MSREHGLPILLLLRLQKTGETADG
jgi:hypothetical protein